MSYVHWSSAEWIAQPAFLTGLAGLGQPAATPTLSAGQYGLAMSRVNFSADAVRLLVLSKTFRDMAKVLDAAYVDHGTWRTLQAKNENLKLDNDYRIAAGTLKGRRILYVGIADAGSRFIDGPSTENPIGWDIIQLKMSPSDDGPIPWVEAVAHESSHALARVKAKGSGPSTPIQRVRASVLDECNARTVEQRVLAEIRATAAGRAALAGHPPARVHECDCERDWFPVSQKRTYLEHFVLGADWESAAKQLGTAEVKKITADVAAIPLMKSVSSHKPTIFLDIMQGSPIATYAKQFPVLQSAAGQAAFVLRLVDESWRQLIGKLGQTSDIWLGAREPRLELHARIFFKITVGYTKKCP